MSQTVKTTFVSNTAPVGYADAVEAAESLVGTEITAGGVRLLVKERVADTLTGATWFSGVVKTGSPLLPSVPVDIVISPWSSGRSDIGLRPLGRLGALSSGRTFRFLNAAWAVLPALIERLSAAVPAEAPAASRTLQAA